MCGLYRFRSLRLLLLTGCAPWLISCSAAKTKPAAPIAVTGRVATAAGKPVADMVISFHPQDTANSSNRPSAALDKDGRFSIECIPGRYKVTLAPIPRHHGSAEGTGELAAAPGKGADPAKAARDMSSPYLDAQSSPWDLTIGSEGKEVNLILK